MVVALFMGMRGMVAILAMNVVMVMPVSVSHTAKPARTGPVSSCPVMDMMPDIAWIGDTELAPHALTLMGLGPIRAEIVFHPAVRAADANALAVSGTVTGAHLLQAAAEA